MRWTIAFEPYTQAQTIQLTLSRLFNESDVVVSDIETLFFSEFVSFSSLCSTLTINQTSAVLNGVTVECATRSTVQSTDSFTIRGEVTPMMSALYIGQLV